MSYMKNRNKRCMTLGEYGAFWFVMSHSRQDESFLCTA